MRCARVLALLTYLALTPVTGAVAADRRVEGTVKSVDAEKSTITLTTAAPKDETLDVVRKARITVNGKAAALKDVKRGQRAVALYNGELEVVTKLDATGEGIALMVPEITVLNELPEPELDHTGPWPTADGLTLYWKNQPGAGGRQAWIWSARRRTTENLFEDGKRLVPGSDMTVSADGREMILLQGENLWVTTRPSIDAAFARPRKITEFDGQGFIAVPCLSGNDLILYADRFSRGQPVAPVKSIRTSRQGKWGVPTLVNVALPAGKRMRFFSVTPDGSRAFCSLITVSPEQPNGPVRLNRSELAMMRAKGDGFGQPEVIRINGEVLNGIFPRYVAATNEFFFVRHEEGKRAEIVLVRNFDPDSIETAPPVAKQPSRPARELLQGEWVSVSEQVSGQHLSPDQLEKMNKRISVKGDRFVIRRVGLAGKFGIYDGTFRIGTTTDPKTFDWSGKGPEGNTEIQGVCELDGDTFRVCYIVTSSGASRPDTLESPEGSKRILNVFRRDRK